MKKSLILITTSAMILAAIPNAASAAETTKSADTTMNSEKSLSTALIKNGNYFLTLDQKTKGFLQTMTGSGVLHEISSGPDGQMILLNEDESYLKLKYDLNDEFVLLLKNIIADANNKGVLQGGQAQQNVRVSLPQGPSINNQAPNVVSPQIFLQDSKIYFTQEDIDLYLFVAAGIGPEALAAALSAVAFLFGGPVGSVITLALTLIGIGTLTNLCYLIIQAKVNNKNGVYIGLNWDGFFPNYSQGTW
ncbi:hypothetical protein BBD42_08535 [Paenibacillus sp. BIHB 4019]|uniref:Uncharacterized protein n=1 Tax=Paenibacillus sp. BIHB 4019 TaxID=1870819 RepID=A0A1B2DFP8_9BACL|nr:hypothetical protein [Paenibacillus sp. BIHB 4019]ANY66499.1 hypothetical protein BBD42_08535 [Paenibacillus sp. BIHB 4019]